MVYEIRKITLTEKELVSALESYRRITPNFLPEGRVVKCQPLDTERLQVVLEIVAGSGKQPIEFKLLTSDLLKPLIRFCIENNIMLPRDGRKTAATENGKASLYVALDLALDLSEIVNPLHLDHLKVKKTVEGAIPKEYVRT